MRRNVIRHIAERLHALIKEAAPVLLPKTWYGMPAAAPPVLTPWPGRA